MASNSLPTNTSQLIQLANNNLAGLKLLGTTLKITQITPVTFAADLAAFTNAENVFNAARSSEQAASNAVQTAIANIGDWLAVVRGVLTGLFGARWNTMWAQAGFINNSTAVPANGDARIGLASRLVAFFTANPTRQVASMKVTAARGTALGTAVQAAKEALSAAAVAISTSAQAREDAYKTLTVEMRDLIKILSATLENDDPRWLAFGLNIPATNSTPGQPVNVSVHMDDAGAIVVQCDAVPLATRYRWRMLLVGVETEYALATSSTAPLGMITDVLPGQTVKIVVQAVNGKSQGVASEPVPFTVPLTREAKAQAAGKNGHPETAGSGNGNGHAVRSRAR